jgi:hypothetical protein
MIRKFPDDPMSFAQGFLEQAMKLDTKCPLSSLPASFELVTGARARLQRLRRAWGVRVPSQTCVAFCLV